MKKKRAVLLTVIGVVVLLSGFGAFTGFMQSKQRQRAFAYAEQSSSAYAQGDTKTAVQEALQVLPDKLNLFTPAYAPQAQKALTDALGVYNLFDAFQPYMVQNLPSVPHRLSISPDGKTAAAVCAHETVVFDTDTSDVKATLPMIDSELTDAIFIDNTRLAFTGADGVSVYDRESNKILWSGKPATEIAVSQNGCIAAVYQDNTEATVYDGEGHIKTTLSFAGKKQNTVPDNTYANPNDNLFAFNKDGSLLAVSFSDGSIDIFDLNDSDNSYEVLQPTDYTRFEGGFCDKYFVLSAHKASSSAIAVLDLTNYRQTADKENDQVSAVSITDAGIYILSDNLVEKLDPATGDRQALINVTAGLKAFASAGAYILTTAGDGGFTLFNEKGQLLDQRPGGTLYDFIQLAGDYAVVGGRNSAEVQILKLDNHKETEIFTYDLAYQHIDARVNAENTRVTLFSDQSFRLYNSNGALINESEIPGAAAVTEVHYSKNSGNLAVLYKDALRIYSGDNGALLYEKTGLKSVFYAPYGISVLDNGGALNLIDMDTAKPKYIADTDEAYAAYCGVNVGPEILQGRELIGAAAVKGGYMYVLSDGITCSVYNGNGKKMFTVPAEGTGKAFFTDQAVIISPVGGTPGVYSLRTGKLINMLEQDSSVTDISRINGDWVCSCTAMDGSRFGILLNGDYSQLAHLPGLTDISDNTLVFDCYGSLRQSRIYSVEELISLAKAIGGDTVTNEK